jgi:hypothetical protein
MNNHSDWTLRIGQVGGEQDPFVTQLLNGIRQHRMNLKSEPFYRRENGEWTGPLGQLQNNTAREAHLAVVSVSVTVSKHKETVGYWQMACLHPGWTHSRLAL